MNFRDILIGPLALPPIKKSMCMVGEEEVVGEDWGHQAMWTCMKGVWSVCSGFVL